MKAVRYQVIRDSHDVRGIGAFPVKSFIDESEAKMYLSVMEKPNIKDGYSYYINKVELNY